jgi:hypothetical protein
MLFPMAAPSTNLRFGLRGFAAIAIACLLLQLFGHSTHSPRFSSGIGSPAAFCGAGGHEGPAPTPLDRHPCALCGIAAVVASAAETSAVSTAAPHTTTSAPRMKPSSDRLGRAPPGWTSSWSSQAPPRSA